MFLIKICKKKKAFISRILLLLVVAIIFIFSNQKSETSSEMSNRVAQTMKIKANENWKTTPSTQPVIAGLNIRKIAHIALYILVGVFCFGSFSNINNKWHQLLFSIITSYFLAIFDEVHQFFVPGRTAGLRDVYVDSIGFIAAILICSVLQYFIKKKVAQ